MCYITYVQEIVQTISDDFITQGWFRNHIFKIKENICIDIK